MLRLMTPVLPEDLQEEWDGSKTIYLKEMLNESTMIVHSFGEFNCIYSIYYNIQTLTERFTAGPFEHTKPTITHALTAHLEDFGNNDSITGFKIRNWECGSYYRFYPDGSIERKKDMWQCAAFDKTKMMTRYFGPNVKIPEKQYERVPDAAGGNTELAAAVRTARMKKGDERRQREHEEREKERLAFLKEIQDMNAKLAILKHVGQNEKDYADLKWETMNLTEAYEKEYEWDRCDECDAPVHPSDGERVRVRGITIRSCGYCLYK